MNATKTPRTRVVAMLFGLLILLSLSVFAQNGEYAIRDARIVPVIGPVIARGSVHIKDGKIVAVGERITIPGYGESNRWSRTLSLSRPDRQWNDPRTRGDRVHSGNEGHH
jgi:hypothetical protein